jgi:flagellar protein FliO/FliZ
MKLNIAILAGVLLPSVSIAAEKVALGAPDLASYGKLSAGLVFVLGTFLCAAWFFKKSKILNPGSDQLKMIAQISVGTKEKIALIQVEGENVLVGITGSNINLLRHYKDKKLIFKDEQYKALEGRPSNDKSRV